MDIWVVFTFATMNNVGFMFLCGHINLIFLSKYLRLELLGHIITLCLTFWRTGKLFSKAATPKFSPALYENSSFSNTCYCPSFLSLAILVGVKWYLIAILIRHWTTDWFQIEKGVCQGCILSPCLFNFYAEYIIRNTGLEEAQAGIKLLGEISITSDMQMTPPLWQKVEELKTSWWKWKRRVKKLP